jgi:hypothetical protein
VTEVLGALLVIAAGAAAWWLARRIEPHWVSRDGHRFICRGQLVDLRGTDAGRDREYRVIVQDDGSIVAGPRSLVRIAPRPWHVIGRAPQAPRRRAVFLLGGGDEEGRMLALRLPASSRAVDVLDELAGR